MSFLSLVVQTSSFAPSRFVVMQPTPSRVSSP